ncbi:hypothetical protein GQX74_004615 [Glossina fuscipes]|nr:hypothetical protein GQX74_004615 [Glossina fuscipes]
MMLVWGFRKRAKNSSCAHDQCRTSTMNCQCFSSSPSSNKDKNEINNEISVHYSYLPKHIRIYFIITLGGSATNISSLLIIIRMNTQVKKKVYTIMPNNKSQAVLTF